MLLGELTWPEAQEHARRGSVVILPTGSTEQHGPHLPLHTDISCAFEIAKRVADRAGCLVAPPLPFGYSELWHRYPGTISFTPPTFRAAVLDICQSLIRTGFKRLFILNGHNPNLAPLQAIAEEVVDRYEDRSISIAVASYFFMGKEACDRIGDNFRDGTHANEFETSLQLALCPTLVKFDLVKDRPYVYDRVICFAEGAMVVNAWPDPASHNGIYGNPAAASAEKGRAYLDALIQAIVDFVGRFREGKHDPIPLPPDAHARC